MNSIHQFRVDGLDGGVIDLAKFAGKKILVVNVASECGYTPQYQQLQELHEHFADRLVVIGFPCNDFGGQEPGSPEEIRRFCERRYGVSFPLTAKVRIKGADPHPVYRWLTDKSLNGALDSAVAWNFHKFLLDEQGRLIAAFPSGTSPFSDELVQLLNP